MNKVLKRITGISLVLLPIVLALVAGIIEGGLSRIFAMMLITFMLIIICVWCGLYLIDKSTE